MPFYERKDCLSKEILSKIILVIFFSTLFTISLPSAFAATVSLAWDPSGPNVSGYKLHYGTSSRNYPYKVDTGKSTSCSLSGLTAGKKYYFAATAYDSSRVESNYSGEISYTVPTTGTTSSSTSSGTSGTFTPYVSSSSTTTSTSSSNGGAGTGGSYSLLMSSSVGKTPAMPLGGATVSGDIYVFTRPDAGVDRVNFYLDGKYHQVENFPPYDFEGNAGNGLPIPFDTNQLNDGQHDIRAVFDLTNGSIEEVFETFTVSNSGVGTGSHNLMMSSSSKRFNAVALDGRSVSGDIYVFTRPDAGVNRVTFYLDGYSYKVENHAPYDIAGSEAVSGDAYPFDTTALNNGQHKIRAVIVLAGGSTEQVTSYFTVNN